MERKRIRDYLNKTKIKGKNENKIFELCFNHVLDVLGKNDRDYEISLSLVGLEERHKLNLEYRKQDRPTDVLTFAFREADFVEDEPVVDLGSIILCPQVGKKQAKVYGHPYEREMAFLFIHGLLHSFGYDHHGPKEEAEKMFALQNQILNTLPYDFYTDIRKAKKLILEAQAKSYSPYSKFRVGAVVLTKDGKYHEGFNIENSATPLGICAERCALFRTYAEGYQKDDIVSLSLITDAKEIGSPCGGCRQVRSELRNSYCPVYIYNNDETKVLRTTVGDLLPYSFGHEEYFNR